MITDFKSLKKNSSKFLEEVKKKSEETKSFQTDPRFWEPEYDKATGTGSAIIRFLPPPKGEDVPWQRLWRHFFKGPGNRWYIENCPTTIGKECPVCEENNLLWNTNIEANKNIARERKRNLVYYSNIYVISDPGRPENEGKVFLYKFNKMIFDKINEKLLPEFANEKSVNIFDFWEGSDFRLKISKNQGGYRTYIKSSFDSPSPLLNGDEEKLKAIWESEYPLVEFVKPSLFKPYEELKKEYDRVWNKTSIVGTVEETKDDDDVPWEKGEDEKPILEKKIKKKPVPKVEEDDDEEDDALARFRKLAEED
jgi:hypothetical protein